VINIIKMNDKNQFNILPMYKAINYTTKQDEYRPFTQGEFFIDSNNRLQCNLITFTDVLKSEQDIENSEFLGVGITFDGAEKPLYIIGNDIKTKCMLGDDELDCVVMIKYYTSGDQQGLYWGIKIAIDINNILGILNLDTNVKNFKFNFFSRFMFNDKFAVCSYYPLKNENIFSSENLYKSNIDNIL